ncbi:peptidoglycan synthetase [Arcobacter sp. YIC-310]|uniref:peptidoglycan synthetase n=1 Tax=Arcobacter sp. YIC-310 TaxID=3376632 RepID=UPI003C183F56
MQISSLIDIIDGRLLNSPSISFIYSFKTDPSKVKEGDLFIARTINDIPLAVQNGAFAIVSQDIHPIIDKEIAWIKVLDVDLSIIQLIRFKLANYNIKAYHCNNASYDLMKIYSQTTSKNIKFISNNLDSFIKNIDDIQDNDVIFSRNKELLEKIYPNIEAFDYKIKYANLIEHSLFEVSFTYKDIYFSKLKLSKIYIEDFLRVYDFFNKDIDLLKLKSFNYFKPLFLDKSLEIIEFGKSDKFIITQNNLELVASEISYLKNKFKYAKTLFITSKYSQHLEKNQIIVKTTDELKKILKKNSFNAVYVIGFTYDEIAQALQKLEKQASLF